MAFTWTEQNVLNLTEDEQTRRDGAKLATRAKWPTLGVDEQAIWGECQGSGKTPYRVSIDQRELAYRCSCPSKKFPCKHTLGLLLLFAKDPTLFQNVAALEWVTTWLESRQARTAKSPSPVVNQEAQAKRVQARVAKIDEGLQELRLWLCDLVRHGFTNPQVKSYAYWDRMAARMVDAQASAIARRLRQIATIPMRGDAEWAARLLVEVSRLYLLADSYQRIDSLPAELQEDLRTGIGWPRKKDELLTLPSVRDKWTVVGQWIEGDDSLRARRVWLYGEHTQRVALILDFAPGRTPFDETYVAGQQYDAELVYYPSAFPQRALVKQVIGISTRTLDDLTFLAHESFSAMLEQYASALGCNPWLERLPFILRRAVLSPHSEGVSLYDAELRTLPLKPPATGDLHLWVNIARSGGHPTTVVGEWDGYEVNLLEVMAV
jgi:hypothetical protein